MTVKMVLVQPLLPTTAVSAGAPDAPTSGPQGGARAGHPSVGSFLERICCVGASLGDVSWEPALPRPQTQTLCPQVVLSLGNLSWPCVLLGEIEAAWQAPSSSITEGRKVLSPLSFSRDLTETSQISVPHSPALVKCFLHSS